MQKLTILNSKEIKRMKELVTAEFGAFLTVDYAYLQNENERVYLVNKDIVRINLDNLRLDKVGLYFAEWKDQQFRLSKEGAQLLYLEAKEQLKNVIELTAEEVKRYFQGLDLEKPLELGNQQLLLKHQEHILGCAKYKNGKILNFLPKIHRGEVIL